jgi:hypothetical protein
VRNGLEFCEPKKSAGALDRVNRAKNACERAAVSRIFFQVDEFAVEQVQIFAALHQKLADDVVAHAESRPAKSEMHCVAEIRTA